MFFILSAFACFFDKNDETSMPHCEETLETIDTSDEFKEFSWQNWLDTLGENGQVSGDVAILWEDSGADCLTWQFIPDENTANYVYSEVVVPESGEVALIQPICVDAVEISGSLSLQSGDGRINETLSTTMRRYFGEPYGTDVQASFSLEVPEWKGTLDVSSFESSTSFDEQSLYLDLFIGEGGLSGEFSLQTEGSDEETAWASQAPIASFDGECPDIVE